MRPAAEWRNTLLGDAVPADTVFATGREGLPTLQVRGLWMHSRYRPREEAARLVDSAGIPSGKPVLVVGLGLGYHVQELIARGHDVAVAEPSHAVAGLALHQVLKDTEFLLAVGDVKEVGASEQFCAFAKRSPHVLIHPPTANLYPGYADAVVAQMSRAALEGKRLSVAVVGPLYGGSLPIAEHLVRALKKLGHRTLFVDNSAAWALYESVQASVRTKTASRQLESLLVNMLSEWCYARVAEFLPEICVAVAQAPVGAAFPDRLRIHGIVSAFWYMENWRHLPYWREIAPHYDCFFHIQPGEFEERLSAIGCRHHAFLPTGCDADLHKPVQLTEAERDEFSCDISFAGAGYHNRNRLLSGLTDYDMKIWGVNWTARELQPFVQRAEQRYGPETFAKIVAGSKINLNLHSSTTHSGVDPAADAINPRVFEIAACGGFQLCDPCKGLERFFDFDSELPVYRSLPELREKVAYYLERPDERRAIATRARDRALRDHTYEKRAQQMLDAVLSAHGGRILEKGVRTQRTVAETADLVGADTELGRYLATLPRDLPFLMQDIERHIPVLGTPLSHPEAVFAMLREVRDNADALIQAFD